MPQTRARLPQGPPPQTPARPPRGIRWWRAPDYAHVGNAIVPVGEPEAVELDPKDIDWDALERWGQLKNDGADDATIKEMCQWCRRFGAVGYFMTSVTSIVLPFVIRIEAWEHPPEEEMTLEVRSYYRVGGAWFTDCFTQGNLEDLEAMGYRWSGTLSKDSSIGDDCILIYDPKIGGAAPITPTIEDLAQRLRAPLERCPQPNTSEFWALYQEPITDILSAGQIFNTLRPESISTAAPRDVNGQLHILRQGTSLVLNADGQPEMRTASLLNVYALHRVLQPHTLLQCARDDCNRSFAARTATQKFCTPRCANTTNKRSKRHAAAQRSPGTSVGRRQRPPKTTPATKRRRQ